MVFEAMSVGASCILAISIPFTRELISQGSRGDSGRNDTGVGMQRGFVLNIQRYCVHDGPGIRTTVFLKGCPLRCWWCHNPESQRVGAEIGFVASRCMRRGQCGEACPQRPSDMAPGPLPRERSTEDRCTRCGACVDACPTRAREIVGREMTSGAVLEEVLRDRIFFEDSGGGVTFSGGEPLLQADFPQRLTSACSRCLHSHNGRYLRLCKRETLWLVPLVDLFLYDIKAIDDELHRRQTGVSNAVILENLTALAACHGNIWIRIPLIPGVNDAPEQLRAAARFVAYPAGRAAGEPATVSSIRRSQGPPSLPRIALVQNLSRWHNCRRRRRSFRKLDFIFGWVDDHGGENRQTAKRESRGNALLVARASVPVD